MLFTSARFTVLGDVNQVVEKDAPVPFHEDAAAILNKGETVTLFLNRSYRCSFEINQFTQKLLGQGEELAFERHETEPGIVFAGDAAALDSALAGDIARSFAQGYESAAVICKTLREASELAARLKPVTDVRLAGDAENGRGALVLPSYMARGLEFDVVLVYGVNRENYATDMDRKLLYLACTRALHRLALYYTGEKSPLLLDEWCPPGR
ncbi:MAG: ATP-binding domain-containing protein [Peptococcaceae bacterium]|jgi:DNA helicase-2/ATP-dependent DNA helicase PcrA|nr:ATP-binding domain-containing protein [Peptococcaceae bacterium]